MTAPRSRIETQQRTKVTMVGPSGQAAREGNVKGPLRLGQSVQCPRRDEPP